MQSLTDCKMHSPRKHFYNTIPASKTREYLKEGNGRIIRALGLEDFCESMAPGKFMFPVDKVPN